MSAALTDAATHPCLECGACCAVYRVQFHERHLESHGGTVPDSLTAPGPSPGHRRMRTRSGTSRCVCLYGRLAEHVRCAIYDRRAPVCREFEPAWEYGQPSPFCDDARIQIGLAPLTPEDWGLVPTSDGE